VPEKKRRGGFGETKDAAGQKSNAFSEKKEGREVQHQTSTLIAGGAVVFAEGEGRMIRLP